MNDEPTPAQLKARAEWAKRREQQAQRERIRKVPFPGPWPDKGTGFCVWCGFIIIDQKTKAKSKRAHWHKGCLRDYNLHSRLETQFNFVEARDGLKCAWPGCGASPERWHSDRIDVVSFECPSMPWEGTRNGEPYWQALTAWRAEHGWHEIYWSIDRRTALQLDHKIPLWKVADLPDEERRWYFGPGNLWLLCPDHHKDKTKIEAAERARLKAEAKDSGQPDLFSA